MAKKSDRRKFLGKLALGATAAASAPFLAGMTTNKKDNKEMNAIKKVRALGFQWETRDPFLFCVHHEDDYPEGNENLGPKASLAGRQLGSDFHIKDGWRMYHGKEVPGFPGHPHRGFETLTVVRKGIVDHSDSAGGAGRYGNGDLQWMTAGSGLMHSEMFPLVHKDKKNPLELFQIWLNLPRKNKMEKPDYKMFWSEEIPNFQKDGAYIEVMAGELFGHRSPEPPKPSWANDPENHVGVFNIQLEPNTTFELPATAEGVNRSIYYYEGTGLTVEGKDVSDYHALDVRPEFPITFKTGDSAVKFLVLQGKPIDEPVVQHGPFVMNSRQEIQEAFADYQRTQFGGWPWPKYEQTHGDDTGRFAKYSDGSFEERS